MSEHIGRQEAAIEPLGVRDALDVRTPVVEGRPDVTVTADIPFSSYATDRRLLGSGPNELAAVRAERDAALERMYEAIDSLHGAEAEKASALGRITELEWSLHVRENELVALRNKLQDLLDDDWFRSLNTRRAAQMKQLIRSMARW